MKLKQIFFTSDLHFGHANVIKFSNRPFKDLEHMTSQLIRNFNKTVPPDGLTYFVGDICFLGAEKNREIISQLNGTKVLIRGNHDRGIQSSYDSGFDVVLNSATIFIGKQKVTISHCPLPNTFRENTENFKGGKTSENWHGENRYLDYIVPNEGQFHLHGHIHSPNSGASQRELGRQFDVGVDANNYRPVHISTIESWIQRRLADEKNESGNI